MSFVCLCREFRLLPYSSAIVAELRLDVGVQPILAAFALLSLPRFAAAAAAAAAVLKIVFFFFVVVGNKEGGTSTGGAAFTDGTLRFWRLRFVMLNWWVFRLFFSWQWRRYWRFFESNPLHL